MLSVCIEAIGVLAPGLHGWPTARAVLAGESRYAPAPLPRFKPALLPANERRRATWLMQLALQAVEECITGLDAAARGALASVFASSGGDMANLHTLCEQLARDAKAISPTAFHNSVHNAVAGYFGIGVGARAASVSLSAHDASFIAGLREAMAWVQTRSDPVLLVAYDAVAPAPLFAKRPIEPDFAVALLLAPLRASEARARAACETAPLAELTLHVDAATKDSATRMPETGMTDEALEAVRVGNPAARVLPLLQAIATRRCAQLVLHEAGLVWRLGVAL